jgi:hypothetical protein
MSGTAPYQAGVLAPCPTHCPGVARQAGFFRAPNGRHYRPASDRRMLAIA